MSVPTNSPTVEEAEAIFSEEVQQPKEESKALAISGEDRAKEIFVQNPGLWTSLSTPAAILNSLGQSDFNLIEFCNAGGVIVTEHILSHPVTIEKEDGELEEALRVVLVDNQGKTYSSVATGVKKSISNLFMIFGLPPYNPPVKLKAVEVRTRKGFRTVNLKAVE